MRGHLWQQGRTCHPLGMRFAEPRTSGHWYRGLCCAASITSANFYLFCGHGGLIVRALVLYSGRLNPAPLRLTFVSPPGIVAGIGTVGYAVPPQSPLLTFVSFVATEALLFGLWYHTLAASILHLCS